MMLQFNVLLGVIMLGGLLLRVSPVKASMLALLLAASKVHCMVSQYVSYFDDPFGRAGDFVVDSFTNEGRKAAGIDHRRRRDTFDASSRVLAIQKHARHAMERIDYWHAKDHWLNLTDIIPLVGPYQMSPPTIDNIVATRQQQRQEDGSLLSSPLVFSKQHLFFHLPKTGGSGDFQHLRRLVGMRTPQRRALYDAHPQMVPFTPCRWFPREENRVDLHSKKHSTLGHVKNSFFCTMLHTEDLGHDGSFQHAFTMVRQPVHHVISQYFYCKESIHHQHKAMFMPDTLQDWLQAWVDYMIASDVPVLAVRAGGEVLPERLTNFHCYDPRNLQASRLRFQYSKLKEQQGQQSSNRNEAERRLSLEVKNDLMSRFQVLGVLDRWEETFCVMAIQYSGWVPPSCDCTKEEEEETIRRAASTP